MLIVTFWTDDKYRALGEKLLESAGAVGLKGYGKAYPPTRLWSQGIAIKPSLILDALNTHKNEDILFMDADTRFVRHPEILTSQGDFDVAMNFLRPNHPHACVIFWRNNQKARALCEKWAGMWERYPSVRLDEAHLSFALKEMAGRISVNHLPPSYTWMEDQMRSSYPTAVPVIEHFGSGFGTDKAETMAQVDLIK